VRFIEFLEVICVADLMPDFELEIPQRMQDGLDGLFVDGLLEKKRGGQYPIEDEYALDRTRQWQTARMSATVADLPKTPAKPRRSWR